MCNDTPRNTGWKNQVSIVTLTTVTSKHFSWESSFVYSLDITNKGVETPYKKIQNHLIAIDLSSNKFEGEISEVIGNLKGCICPTYPKTFLSIISHHPWELN